MTPQEVNLLEADLLPKGVVLGSTHAGILLLVICIGLSGYSYWLQSQLTPLQSAKQTLSERVNGLRQTQPDTSDSLVDLQAELEQLIVDVRQQDLLIDTLNDSEPELFSAYLRGLANAQVARLWLRRIELRDAGEAGFMIALSGAAAEPRSVPQLLHALAAEPVFTGHMFRLVQIEQAERWHEFNIASTWEDAS